MTCGIGSARPHQHVTRHRGPQALGTGLAGLLLALHTVSERRGSPSARWIAGVDAFASAAMTLVSLVGGFVTAVEWGRTDGRDSLPRSTMNVINTAIFLLFVATIAWVRAF